MKGPTTSSGVAAGWSLMSRAAAPALTVKAVLFPAARLSPLVRVAVKTTPLSAGSIAVAGKTFLGWTKLSFPGGQTGWVRTEDLIPLYR